MSSVYDRSPAGAPLRAAPSGAAALAGLPEWDLSDLYAGMDAPEFVRDLASVAADAVAFETEWKGRLAQEAANPAAGGLGRALRRYEEIEELMGRIGSYAGLLYAGDTSDPVRAKFYGDVQEKLTDASAHLLFFTLELNRIDDALVDAALDADPGFGRYRPWIVDLRQDKPYQLEDRVEQLFHEKSITGRAAWNRLFDETMTALRFDVGGESLTLEPTLNGLQDPDPAVRQRAA
ncbi:MAG: oligoendopeptidase F, partial [Aquamicrobium sp.]|nr:oligoendopeptidase F [Aquamicrobium sp.]